MALSSHGVRLKSLSSGAQQLRHCGKVPITFLRPAVSEVNREVRKQGVHILPWFIPSPQTGDGEGMPKRHQAGSTPLRRGLDGQALAESSKPVMHGQILQGLTLFGDEEGIRHRIVLQACSLLTVMAERLRRAGMERHNAGFVELRLQDMQRRREMVELDIAGL
jgi:hypothetical protein